MGFYDCREGKDGWFFLGNDHQFEYDQVLARKKVSEEFLDDWIENLANMYYFCQRNSVTFIATSAPAKGSVYLDKHPETDFADPSRSVLAQIIERSVARKLPFLDLRRPLIEARKINDTYSRLNSHWSDYGGWVAWTAITNELVNQEIGFRQVDGLRNPIITQVDSHNEMESLMGLRATNNWTRPIFEKYFTTIEVINHLGVKEEKDWTFEINLVDIPVDVTCESAPNRLSCLVFCDSTITSISPYLNITFHHVAYRNHHFTWDGRPCDFVYYVRKIKPDIIIYMFTERYVIIPFHKKEYWRALTVFENAKIIEKYSWPFRLPYLPLACLGGSNLRRPNLIKLPDISDSYLYVLEITVSSLGSASVMHSYVVGGHTGQCWHYLQEGDNTFYVEIPSSVTGRDFWLVRDGDQAECFLRSVELRVLFQGSNA